MTNEAELLLKLQEKLEALSKRQESFSAEIFALQEEIKSLKSVLFIQQPDAISPPKPEVFNETASYPEIDFVAPILNEKNINLPEGIPQIPVIPSTQPPKVKSDLEHFIGSNVINKIGIAITIIGVAIGAQYSIEHDLISPLARICLGYVIGLGLIGFGFRLKKNYTDFSAVLVSGAIAIMYFITYAAFSFYQFLPQSVAFSLMVLFTVLTIAAAMNYNRQVIAHIGLVGAYAVPFLLNDDSKNVAILYSYMAIINIGILIIAVRKYWKPLYYSSFILTWFIFSFWYWLHYEDASQYNVFWIFAFVFFIIFYLIFISYKLLHQEKFQATDVLLILSNSFIFYGLGYSALTTHLYGDRLLGLFTMANALIHLCVTLFIYSQKNRDPSLFSMVAGLVMVFITIAIPVQLDGSWVTLLWAGEAALLFWIGRMRHDPVYVRLSYGLILLSFASIIGDWTTIYNQYIPDVPATRTTPFLNIHFFTSLLFIAAFAFINYLNRKKAESETLAIEQSLHSFMQIAIPAILLTAVYFTFSMEINLYWNQLYLDSATTITPEGDVYASTYWNEDLNAFKEIWLMNYSLLFVTALAFFNNKFFREKKLAMTCLILGTIFIISFLTEGFIMMNQLAESYLNPSDPYVRSGFNILIRYITYGFAGLMLYNMHQTIKADKTFAQNQSLKIGFDVLLHVTIISVLSNEWITWLGFLRFSESTRLGLSILWGIYALILIILGIWKSKRHLRVGAIALFAVTLIKLAFYDITHLNTIAKTIIFVSLGILLLIISFLYNKYKHVTHA